MSENVKKKLRLQKKRLCSLTELDKLNVRGGEDITIKTKTENDS